MDYSLSDEQRDLLDRLDAFCQANLSETEVQQWIAEGGVPDAFVQKYYQEGFGRIGLPSKMGGISTPIVTRVMVLERLAFHAGASLPTQSMMTYMHFVSNVANEEQIELLRGITEETGKMAFSFAISEPQSGSKAFDVHTNAREVEDGFIINGVKAFISSGQYAPYIILIARDLSLDADAASGDEPLTFFLVKRDTPGIDTFPMRKVGQHLIPTADILFEDVHVGKDAVMGQRGSGGREMLRSFDFGRLYLCATTVGLAESAFDQAMHYAVNRHIGSDTVSSFQQIQAMLCDMQTNVDAMRALLYKTACELDKCPKEARLTTALLKRFVPKTSVQVADDAMQILGGLGYRASTKAARIWQECRGNRIILGTDEIMTTVAAKRMVSRYESGKGIDSFWSM